MFKRFMDQEAMLEHEYTERLSQIAEEGPIFENPEDEFTPIEQAEF